MASQTALNPPRPMGRFHPTADDLQGEWEGVPATEFEDGDIVLVTDDRTAALKALTAYAADMGLDLEFHSDMEARWVVFEWQPEDAEYRYFMHFTTEDADMALPVHYLPA